MNPHDKFCAFAHSRFKVHAVNTAFDVDQTHACAEAHLADLVAGGGVAGLKHLLHIWDAGAVICGGHGNAMRLDF